jgi:pilus assembly protein CpaB
MNRQTRTFIVLLVAVGAAGLASFGVYRAISSIPERRVEIATKHAVVAAKSLPLGELLTKESVKLVAWPEATPLEGGFDTIEEVIDRGLISSVVLNEPITENKLAAKEAGAGLPPTIDPGMRAISIKVNDVSNVAGFVAPGTRVDVVVVIEDENAKDKLSRVVVSNVEVLTAGTRFDQDEARKDGKAVRSTVITLMVSPVDAERIALAQSEGDLMLTLRNPLDVDPTTTTGVRKRALFASETPAPSPERPAVRRATAKAPTPAPAPLPVIPAVQTLRIETIRAAKRTEAVIQAD